MSGIFGGVPSPGSARRHNHALDADTLGLWRLDGPETISVANMQRDQTGNYHMSLISGSDSSPASPLVTDKGHASNKDVIYRCNTDPALVSALKADPGWTVELWFNNIDSINGDIGDRMLFCVGTSTMNHYSEEENDLFLIKSSAGGAVWNVAVMVPGSTDNSWQNFTFGAMPTTPGIHHVAAVWEPYDSSNAYVRMYMDGVQSGSQVSGGRLTNPVAGTYSVIQFRGYPVNNYRPLNFLVDDIRLSKRARTQAEILQSYNNGR